MRRLFASVALIIAAAALSGCYYQPGYGYVRGGNYSGDAYYGTPAPVYNSGYYDGYYDGYGYGGYGGCCYAPGVSVGIRSVWYGGSGYRRDGRAYYGHDYDRRGESQRGGRYGGRGDSHSSRGGDSGRGGHQRRRDRDGDGH